MNPIPRWLLTTAIASAIATSVCATSAWAQSPGKPSDAQIAHIVYTADTIDIKAGQLALQKSQNADVRGFAQDMVRDHTAVNEKALALLKQLGVQPQDNDTSRALVRQAEAETKKLEALNGVAFDKAYAEHELAYHRQVNDAVRGTLIPAASNQELKQLLETGLKIFEGHQQHAEQLVRTLK
jgi:putative membrane protein